MMLLANPAWRTQAHATDDRSLLDHCKAMVAQAQPQAFYRIRGRRAPALSADHPRVYARAFPA
jgi:hypothetical protein